MLKGHQNLRDTKPWARVYISTSSFYFTTTPSHSCQHNASIQTEYLSNIGQSIACTLSHLQKSGLTIDTRLTSDVEYVNVHRYCKVAQWRGRVEGLCRRLLHVCISKQDFHPAVTHTLAAKICALCPISCVAASYCQLVGRVHEVEVKVKGDRLIDVLSSGYCPY
jgi:hypothetical protein